MTTVLILIIALLAGWCVNEHLTIEVIKGQRDEALDRLHRLTGEEL